jgi:hypothetical protein
MLVTWYCLSCYCVISAWTFCILLSKICHYCSLVFSLGIFLQLFSLQINTIYRCISPIVIITASAITLLYYITSYSPWLFHHYNVATITSVWINQCIWLLSWYTDTHFLEFLQTSLICNSIHYSSKQLSFLSSFLSGVLSFFFFLS